MDQLPEIQPLEPRRKDEEKKKAGAAWLFDAGKDAEGLAAGGAGEGGAASAFSRSFLGRAWTQLARWLAQGGSIFATAKGRMIMTLLACLTAALNHWFFANAAAANASASLSAPPLFNGQRHEGKAWEEPDLWNTDLSKTPNSVGLVSAGADPDAAARAAAAKAAAEAEAAKNAGGAGDPGAAGAMGGAKDANGKDLPPGANLPPGPGQMSSRDNLPNNKLGQMKPWMPSGSSVGSSTALFGGVGKAFSAIKTLALKPFSGQAQTARAASSRPTVSGGRGVGPARRALNQAFGLGKIARNTAGLEGASVAAGQVFDNASDPGNTITGTGSGPSGSPIGGAGIAPGQSAQGTETQMGGPTGGGAPGATGDPNAPLDPQASCDQKFPDGGMIATPEGGCAPSAGHKNATPWQGQANMAQMLMMVATVVLLLAEIFGKLGKVWAICYTIAFMLAMIAAVLGAIVCVLGIMLLAQGQVMQGAIYSLSGALITVAGLACAAGQAEHLEPSSMMGKMATHISDFMKSIHLFGSATTTAAAAH